MCAQDKICSLVSTSLDYDILRITYVGTGSQYSNLSQAKVRKEGHCHSVAELYVKSVHLNIFWWRGLEVHGTL
jgi:hypothetical protein